MLGHNTGVESVKADRELKRMFVCVLERACRVCVYMVYTPLLACVLRQLFLATLSLSTDTCTYVLNNFKAYHFFSLAISTHMKD